MSESTQDATGDALDRRLVRVQAASGAVFALFLLVHLANQAAASLGPAVYDDTQRALRAVYQAPLVEVGLVLGPLCVHAVCGVLVKLRRRRAGSLAPASVSARLHRWAGNVLLAIVFVHVAIMRGLPLWIDVSFPFAGLAFVFQDMPVDLVAFFVFAVAGLYHTVHGLGVALPRLGVAAGGVLRAPRVLAPVTVGGGVVLLAAMLGFGGWLYETPGLEDSAVAAWMFEAGLAAPDGVAEGGR